MWKKKKLSALFILCSTVNVGGGGGGRRAWLHCCRGNHSAPGQGSNSSLAISKPGAVICVLNKPLSFPKQNAAV